MKAAEPETEIETMNEKQKDQLLARLLLLVPFEGWSETALAEAAQDIGLTTNQTALFFPRGITDVLRYYNQQLDQQVMVRLEASEDLKVREKITLAVRYRLELMTPNREAIRKGISFFTMPLKASEGLHNLYDTVDSIWLAAGDRSTDYNFYSKRMLLAGVYSSTLLYWLEDSSDEYEKTWSFLDRRIAEVLKIGGALGKGIGRLSKVADAVRGLAPKSFTPRC